MRTQNFVRNLNWVWVLTLAVIFTACSQMDGLEPDSKTLEGKSEELFRLSPFGNGFENARVPTGGTTSTPKSNGGITPYIIPGANEGGNRTCAEVATAYGIASFGTSFEQRNAPFADNKATFTGSDGAVITATTDGTFVSWSIEVPAGYCVKYLAAVVKGSNDANVYFYEGDVRGDSGLASPVAGGSGGAAALSNLRFCYTLEEKPQAPEVVGDEECFEEDLVLRATLADGVTIPDGYKLQWYKKVGDEFVEVDDPKLDKVGTIDYYAAFVNGCSSEMSKAATLTIWALPDAPKSKGDQEEEACDIKKLTASVEVAPETKIVWYDAPTGGNVVEDPSLVYDETKGGVQTVTFYAEAVNTDTKCISATRTAVKLTLNPCPPQECWTGESATGLGNAFPTGPSTWFQWNTKAQLIAGVDLVYGRNLVPIGRVTLSGGIITVTLNEGIRFAEGSGALKVIASNTQFTRFSGFSGALSNATINGNTATISVPDRAFYFVHGDIEKIIECPIPE
ncbi:immunoglobulin domain-containing protein [Fontibacter flavus]|uniref:Ig-like domain-containing protein n=1 Tax=Fontibacter flavus TaxID=654838 RepID=A0ABV6FQT7_9BACT